MAYNFSRSEGCSCCSQPENKQEGGIYGLSEAVNAIKEGFASTNDRIGNSTDSINGTSLFSKLGYAIKAITSINLTPLAKDRTVAKQGDNPEATNTAIYELLLSIVNNEDEALGEDDIDDAILPRERP